MHILCTMPGKFGDLLWALPTVRAIAEAAGEPVSLLVSEKYQSILPLIKAQAYIAKADACPSWQVQDTAPMTPVEPPLMALDPQRALTQIDQVIHLGYRAWPTAPLPQYIYDQTAAIYDVPMAALDLTTPWITANSAGPPVDLVIGFTDEWYELKLGIAMIVDQAPGVPLACALCPTGSRWDRETPPGTLAKIVCDWVAAASAIRNADLFLGCCAALHVLACALGKPAIIMEPNPHRWNDIFYPFGKTGPQVTLVTGTDGQPTFDARHVADAIRKVLP